MGNRYNTMSKVTVSFEIDIMKLAGLQKFLGGEAAGASKSGKKPAADEEDTEFTDDEDVTFDDEPTEPTINLNILRAEIKKRMEAGKEAILSKLFAKYKIKNPTALKEEKYEAFYNDLMKIKVK